MKTLPISQHFGKAGPFSDPQVRSPAKSALIAWLIVSFKIRHLTFEITEGIPYQLLILDKGIHVKRLNRCFRESVRRY